MLQSLLLTLLTFVVLSPTHAKSSDNPPRTVESVDLNRYLGRWYEIASIPQFFQRNCARDTTADYSIAPEPGLIRVFNSCTKADGVRIEANGRARVLDTQTNAKLQVTFVKLIDWWFAYDGYYWIIDLDPEYQYAVVGHPERSYAWILARDPAFGLDKQMMATLSERLKANGYNPCDLKTAVQYDGIREVVRLCDYVK
jgi:apolipoprotein D and lipocalin family protein